MSRGDMVPYHGTEVDDGEIYVRAILCPQTTLGVTRLGFKREAIVFPLPTWGEKLRNSNRDKF